MKSHKNLFDCFNLGFMLVINSFIMVVSIISAVAVNFVSQKQRISINCNLQSLLDSSAFEPLLMLTSVISLIAMLYMSSKHLDKRWLKLSKIALVGSLCYQIIPFMLDDLAKSCSIIVIVLGLFLVLVVLLMTITGELVYHIK